MRTVHLLPCMASKGMCVGRKLLSERDENEFGHYFSVHFKCVIVGRKLLSERDENRLIFVRNLTIINKCRKETTL